MTIRILALASMLAQHTLKAKVLLSSCKFAEVVTMSQLKLESTMRHICEFLSSRPNLGGYALAVGKLSTFKQVSVQTKRIGLIRSLSVEGWNFHPNSSSLGWVGLSDLAGSNA